MLTRRSIRVSFAPLAMGVALFGLTGCGLGIGDHVFYRVRVDPGVQDSGCYQNNMVPASDKEDTTNLASSDTFILYIIGDETVELDTGSLVVPGAESDTGYTFSGTATDIDYPIDGIKTTKTTKITVVMNLDGSTTEGKSTTITSNKCEGALCPMNFDTTPCTETNTFKGVEIDHAQVLVGNTPTP
jgi:hypothetical protein